MRIFEILNINFVMDDGLSSCLTCSECFQPQRLKATADDTVELVGLWETLNLHLMWNSRIFLAKYDELIFVKVYFFTASFTGKALSRSHLEIEDYASILKKIMA